MRVALFPFSTIQVILKMGQANGHAYIQLAQQEDKMDHLKKEVQSNPFLSYKAVLLGGLRKRLIYFINMEKYFLKIFIPPESGSTDSVLSTQITKLKITVFAQVYDEFLWLGSESGQINIFAFKSDQNGPPFGSLLHSFDTIEAFKNCPGQMVQLCQEGNEVIFTKKKSFKN